MNTALKGIAACAYTVRAYSTTAAPTWPSSPKESRPRARRIHTLTDGHRLSPGGGPGARDSGLSRSLRRTGRRVRAAFLVFRDLHHDGPRARRDRRVAAARAAAP